MTDNFSRSIDRPILIYKADENDRLGHLILEILHGLNQSTLVSSSEEETKASLVSHESDLILYLSTGSLGPIPNLLRQLGTTHTGVRRQQVVLLEAFEGKNFSNLYAQGADLVLPSTLPAPLLKRHLQGLIETLATQRRYHLLSAAVNSAEAGLLISDTLQPDSPVVYANNSFERLSGYSVKEILDHNCRLLQHRDTSQPNLEVVRNSLHEKKSCSTLLRNYRKGGGYFWNELNLKPIESLDQTGRYFAGTQYNVSSHLESVEEARRKCSQLEAVLEALPGLTWLLEAPGRWTFLNRAACELIGGTRGEDWMTAVHRDDAGILTRAMESAWHDGTESNCEVRVQTAPGQTRKIRHTFVALLGDQGEPCFLIGSGQDVTEQRQLEQTMRERQRYLTAYSLIQKSLKSDEAARQLASLKSIVSVTLEAEIVEFFLLKIPNNLMSITAPLNEKGVPIPAAPQAMEMAGNLWKHASLSQELKTSELITYREEAGHVSIFPLLRHGNCYGLVLILHREETAHDALELDFIRTIKNIAMSSKFWPKTA